MKKYILMLLFVLAGNMAWAMQPCRCPNVETLCATLAEQLASSIQTRVSRTGPIMAVSFVNLHNMERTSDLGRALGEGVANNFFLFGYQIIEPRLRSHSLTTHDESGEFALSRQLQHLDADVRVQAILSGTYAPVDNGLLVSARLVNAQTKTLLATAQCRLRLTPEVVQLLTPHAAPVRDDMPAPLLPIANKQNAKRVQARLRDAGFYKGKIDGVWGRQSQTALQHFRASVGLPPTPVWDAAAQKALMPS